MYTQHRYGYYSTASRNEQHKIAVFATRVVLAGKPPCLPPWGKVAPQGRMRGRFPLPPIPGQPVVGGVPDAPRRLAPTSFPGLPPAETPAAANTRGGAKPPPYGPNH